MLEELTWTSLTERRRIASLLLFYKIHHGLVAVEMPDTLSPRLAELFYTSENSQAYQVLGLSREYH